MKFSDDGTHLVDQIIASGENVWTWSTKPDASEYTGRARFSDVGVGGSLWYSDGVSWNMTGPVVLHNTYWGIIMHSMAAANAATYSQSGTTLTCTCTGHNIPATIHNGKSIHLTPGTPSTGAQLATGLYTNFTYVDANTFTCTSTVSQTGTGALNTNIAATTVPGISIPILGGLLGLNGWIDVYSYQQFNASSGSKRLQFKYDSLQFKNQITGPSQIVIQETHRLQNVNNEAKQMAFAAGSVGYSGATVTATIYGAIDSSLTKDITLVNTFGSALDYMSLDHLVIVLNR